MPQHHEQQVSPYTPEQLFDMVADVGRYPEFLPWCRAARILERTDDGMLAELVISFNHMRESYVSKVTLVRPERIDVVMVRGPFKHLINKWIFSSRADGGTDISFLIDFQFRSLILETVMGGFFNKAVAKMGAAFQTRADALYGVKKP